LFEKDCDEHSWKEWKKEENGQEHSNLRLPSVRESHRGALNPAKGRASTNASARSLVRRPSDRPSVRSSVRWTRQITWLSLGVVDPDAKGRFILE